MSVSLPNPVLPAAARSVAPAEQPGASLPEAGAAVAANDGLSGLPDTGLSTEQLDELAALGDRLLGVSGAAAEAVPLWLRLALAAYCRGWREAGDRILT